MMQKSDHAAADMLFSIGGVANIEEAAKAQGVADLGPLTSMLDVRKHVYRQMDPLAGSLTAGDFIYLWRKRNFTKKMRRLEKLLKRSVGTFSLGDLKDAFAKFYERGYNSASLKAMGKLWKNLVTGKVWTPRRSHQMVELLKKCKTGKTRIKRSLPKGWVFAHKTGTQFKRSCDTGVAFGPAGQKITLAICAQDFVSRKAGDRQYGLIAKAFFKVYNGRSKRGIGRHP